MCVLGSGFGLCFRIASLGIDLVGLLLCKRADEHVVHSTSHIHASFVARGRQEALNLDLMVEDRIQLLSFSLSPVGLEDHDPSVRVY